jgi:hypothetical protein
VSTRTHSLHSASGEAIDDNAAETRKKAAVLEPGRSGSRRSASKAEAARFEASDFRLKA